MENIHICEAIYYTRSLNFARPKECKNRASCIRDGHHYCKIHDPEHQNKLQEKRDRKRITRMKTDFRLHIAYLREKQKRGKA